MEPKMIQLVSGVLL